MFEFGIGVPINHDIAISFYEKSAEMVCSWMIVISNELFFIQQDNLDALKKLSVIFFNSEPERAAEYLQRAINLVSFFLKDNISHPIVFIGRHSLCQ